MSPTYFDDLKVGYRSLVGEWLLERDEAIAFAERWDPQPFHVDEEAAKQTIYGGLIASGWHTCSIYMRLLCDGFLLRVSSMGSPGVDELRWLGPVRPGDTLSVKLRIEDVRASKSKPDRGIVMTAGEVRNQDGELVLTLKSPLMVRRR